MIFSEACFSLGGVESDLIIVLGDSPELCEHEDVVDSPPSLGSQLVHTSCILLSE